jgi:hypothetical protein
MRVAALEVAKSVGEGFGWFFFCGRLLNWSRFGRRIADGFAGRLGLGGWRGFGLWFAYGLGDRLLSGLLSDFFGGHGYSDVFFSHDGSGPFCHDWAAGR